MLRTILGVVLGYVTLALLIFITFSLAYLAMGADGAFQPGSYDVTALWIITSFVLSLLAAIAGGYVCAIVAKTVKAPFALAALIIVLGVVGALMVIMNTSAAKPARTAEVGNLEAMQNAQQPAWVALLNPLIGAAGVVLGARLKKERAPEGRLRTA